MSRPYLGIYGGMGGHDEDGDDEQHEQSVPHGGAQRCFGLFICRQSDEKKLTRNGEWHEKAVAAGAAAVSLKNASGI